MIRFSHHRASDRLELESKFERTDEASKSEDFGTCKTTDAALAPKELQIFASNALAAIFLHCEAIRARSATQCLNSSDIEQSIDRIARNAQRLWLVIEGQPLLMRDLPREK